MINLACNYSLETEELVRDNKIQIDYFKFPALAFDMNILKSYDLSEFQRFAFDVKKIKPILYHGLCPSPHNICSTNFKNELQVDIINKMIEMTGTPGISLHLAGADEKITKEELIKIVVSNIEFLKSKFKGLNFITLENVEKSNSIFVTDPDVISRIIRQADTNFLLDVSHAFCSAYDRSEDFISYIHKLPLEKVYEIHINGWAEKNGDIMSHIKINKMGYDVLKHVLDYCSPKIVTLEYGRHDDRIGIGCPVMTPNNISHKAKNEIIEQINDLKEIIYRY
ncbi:DUF692 family protein [Clostridium estertheticum]|uniref:multinuclear nonheme iron-dependent oxidase n=1 Tax=Clostridium estertheticum TaxID=238834 RepID=UPI0013E9835C|nr:DUF692 family multinuclear iron-containing protein [Clostridium estertheticum]MBZ9689880.1 DUF692 family protein [Clostridium estertheticum]